MVIDKNPVILDNSLMVQNNIIDIKDVSISINGILSIYEEDIISISNNIIYINPNLGINWETDTFVIFYN